MEFATHLVEDLALCVFSSSVSTASNHDAFDTALWSTFRSTGLDQLLSTGESTTLRDATAMLRSAGFQIGRAHV